MRTRLARKTWASAAKASSVQSWPGARNMAETARADGKEDNSLRAPASEARSQYDANTLRVEASRAIADELMEMRSLAHGVGLHIPSHDQYLAMGTRADQTAGMQTPFARDVAEHLPPAQRRTHMSYAQQWYAAITKSARAVLGEDKLNQHQGGGERAA
jgi:hypothetical protein